MKKIAVLSIVAAMSCHAALIHFDLSPPGTDFAVGLSPSNQVPAVTNSTGSGGSISGGISLETDSNILQVAIGYGSAAGFSNLTGVPIGMHIHSPAATNQNAGILVPLDPYNFSAQNPTNGGVIFGAIAYPVAQVSNLLAGLAYVDIHTALNTNGEIRGQLIPVIVTNSPPSVSCPGPSTNECGTPALITVLVSDPDGDALKVVWTLNGSGLQTNTIPASSPGAGVNVAFMGDLPLGTNVVVVTVTDSATNTASCSSMVTVVDTTPPVIHSASASPSSLWPPNHKLVDVTLIAKVTDTCGPATWKIISVTSSEPVTDNGDNGNKDNKGNKGNKGDKGDKGNKGDNGGDGDNTSPDWIITGDHTVQLRAERSGKDKAGRTYSITIQATDESGNTSQKVVKVTVPHNR